MVLMYEEKLYDFLEQLHGEKISDIGRVSNMLWLGIGDIIEILNRKGELVKKSAISLHVQSAWKIVNSQKKEILVASSDFYSPKSTIDKENFDWNKFDWDVQGNNLFDQKAANWLNTRSPIYIEKYNINRYGDLELVFSNSEQLRIFVNSSNNTEAWRLFRFRGEKHLVFTGLGYQFE